jgi:shikimate kinase
VRAAYLLGFRGAGKTTLGRFLAAELGARFLDLDQIFEAEKGEGTVAWIERNGLGSFRAEEARLLRRVEEELRAGAPATIVSLGGGIVEGEASREVLLASPAPKIWLDVPAEELWRRLSRRPERLRVGNLNSLKDLQALLARRQPHFEKISTNRVENCDINESLAELKRVLGSHWR